jgi:hypothetical protein
LQQAMPRDILLAFEHHACGFAAERHVVRPQSWGRVIMGDSQFRVRAHATGWGVYAALFLLVSTITHLDTYFGCTLTSAPLFIGLSIGIVPVSIALVLRSRPWQRERSGPFALRYRQLDWREWRPFLPGWAPRVVYILGAYAMANFLLAVVHLPVQGAGVVLSDAQAIYIARMFSGHWMVFYALPFFFFTYVPRDAARANAPPITAT